MTLNERAGRLADHVAANAATLRIGFHGNHLGARVLDCGVTEQGGLQAGLWLSRVCMSGLGEVNLSTAESGMATAAQITVSTDNPVLACMASQYAGWQIAVGRYFAMGSGPMRAAYGKEELFNHIPGREESPLAVGVLESRKLPTEEVIAYLSSQLGIGSGRLTLLVAPASSLAGSIQVVARSLETALHKLHELKFDIRRVVSGFGTAPLPPVAADDLSAIGRTNDAILYGGRVAIWVRAEDDELAEVGPKVPSCASPDHGEPFSAIFDRAGRDFYKIDPMLFSPAQVVLHNLNTGRSHRFGRLEPAVLEKSFFGL